MSPALLDDAIETAVLAATTASLWFGVIHPPAAPLRRQRVQGDDMIPPSLDSTAENLLRSLPFQGGIIFAPKWRKTS